MGKPNYEDRDGLLVLFRIVNAKGAVASANVKMWDECAEAINNSPYFKGKGWSAGGSTYKTKCQTLLKKRIVELNSGSGYHVLQDELEVLLTRLTDEYSTGIKEVELAKKTKVLKEEGKKVYRADIESNFDPIIVTRGALGEYNKGEEKKGGSTNKSSAGSDELFKMGRGNISNSDRDVSAVSLSESVSDDSVSEIEMVPNVSQR